jgi:hypothetical protein
MIYFPPSPTVGQEYIGVNGATYTWTGNRWSSVVSIETGTAVAYSDGGDASTTQFNNEFDGGTA